MKRLWIYTIALIAVTSTAALAAEPWEMIRSVKVSMVTNGLAKTFQTDYKEKDVYDPEDQIELLNGEPARLVTRFDNEKIDFDNNHSRRHLMVYPLREYRAIFPARVKVKFDERVSQLKQILRTKSTKGIDEIPVFPDCDAHQMFHLQERYLKFANGSGIAFLTEYTNGDPPVSNEGLHYCFEGLTTDGKYYLSLFYPVRASGLPEKSPKGEQYLRELARAKFSPDLNKIDRMIESIALH